MENNHFDLNAKRRMLYKRKKIGFIISSIQQRSPYLITTRHKHIRLKRLQLLH